MGAAVGDALGLPYEGMSKRRARRMLGASRLRHRFVLGRGMVSDDTEHACMVGVALAKAGREPTTFAKSLARSLRWWLVGLPAGIGFGTLRGIAKLWLGFSPDHSGVWSAGNGPAMRAPLIGTYAFQDRVLREALVRASTRITHRDPKAEQGARAIAAVAAYASSHEGQLDPEAVLDKAMLEITDGELRERLGVARNELHRPTEQVIRRWGLDDGITGYIYDTVPAVIHCWARHEGRFEPAIGEIIACGGDTDTTAAILGGLAGATHGFEAIPADWRMRIVEWPRTVPYMMRLGHALATGAQPPRLFVPGILLRNAIFMALVYVQIIRRALPPYG